MHYLIQMCYLTYLFHKTITNFIRNIFIEILRIIKGDSVTIISFYIKGFD